MANTNDIHLGRWTNWSHGKIYGATVTVTAQHGTLIIAFLALFVAWTGNQLWHFICWLIHHMRSGRKRADPIDHQLQALLRTGLLDIPLLWRLVKLSWAWRSNSPRVVRRVLPLALWTVLFAGCVALASIFSSRLVSAGSEALIEPRFCGTPPLDNINMFHAKPSEVPVIQALFALGQVQTDYLRQFVRSCYDSPTAEESTPCNGIVRPNLPVKVDKNAPCPFKDSLCLSPAISVDSGLIDSNFHLGISAPPSDRIKLRKVMTCAPIPAEEKFSTPWTSNYSDTQLMFDPEPASSGVSFRYYFLGNRTSGPAEAKPQPFTFFEANYTGAWKHAYTVFMFSAYRNDPQFQSFDPIQELRRDDGDVSILCLRSRVLYTAKVEDPFFQATTPIDIEGMTLYGPDRTVSVIGCTEQFSFCKEEGNCTPLTALYDSHVPAAELGYNPVQTATYNVLWRSAWGGRLYNLHFFLAENMLLAKDGVFGSHGLAAGLPQDQWQKEVLHAFNVTMAALQHFMIWLMVPLQMESLENHTYEEFVKPVKGPAEQLCHNQKVRSPRHYSFNLLGLCILLGGGTLVILLSLVVPWLVHRLKKSPDGSQHYKHLEWELGDILQLQRIALEDHGVGPWETRGEVPILKRWSKDIELPWITKQLQQEHRHRRQMGSSPDLSTVELINCEGSPGRHSGGRHVEVFPE